MQKNKIIKLKPLKRSVYRFKTTTINIHIDFLNKIAQGENIIIALTLIQFICDFQAICAKIYKY